MAAIDRQFQGTPFYGVRQMTWYLRSKGWQINVKRVHRLMRKMGLMPIYQRPRTSIPAPGHKIYPCLLRDLVIDRPNQVPLSPKASPSSAGQGNQFTSWNFTQKIKAAGIRVSMDGKGRWLDNVFVERLWRPLKYECVYLHAWSGGREARDGIGAWMAFYNQQRPHAAHEGRKPEAPYNQTEIMPPAEMAA